jgi:hypothetical protein
VAKANPVDEAKELQQMLVTYAKQETVEPLKTLGSYLSKGIVGAILMFLGIMFTGLGTLRFFQTEVDSFSGGGWGSLAPYGITLAVFTFMVLILFLSFNRAKKALT